jgi:uncharacterized repeat protein (TIGR01451 family)
MLLPAIKTQAQTCGNALSGSPVISPISGSKVIVGQAVTIQRVFFGSSDPGNCLFRNGEGYLLIPSGTVTKVVTNLNLNPPGTPPLNSFLNCFGTNSTAAEGNCLVYTTTYIVSAADVGKSNAIVLPARGQLTASQTIPFPGVPGEVVFGAAADVDGFNPASPTSPTGFATGSGSQFLIVVSPGITVTKTCDTNCFLPGAPITFHGTVCNTGNIPLVNITVSDTPAATITFAANTSSGNPFNAATGLTNGECINYTGSYQPSGNVCGPFPDTVIASGVAAGVVGNPTVSATNSATCFVCATPCIAVTKNCPGPVNVGQPQTISGIVTNCGNIGLTNVTLTDNILGAITNIASLPVGTAVSYSKTFIAGCVGNTNTVTAVGTSICGGQSVTNTATAPCLVTSTPCMSVTKACTTNLVGTSQTISGVVSNCGNITITNIVITDSVVGAVTTITTLAPGASAPYSKSFTAVCGGNNGTVTAAGTTTCGQPMSAQAVAPCQVFENPCIAVTMACPGPVVVGAQQTISGSVSNCGNVTLTNVVVTDDVFGAITNIATLPVGGSAPYSKTFIAGCSGNTNTVTASGRSICGTLVQNSATSPCQSTSTPCIGVSTACTAVTLGDSETVSGTVTNCGNIALTNVVVTDSVLGIVGNIPTMSAGSTAPYSKTFTASLCGTNVGRVTATGTSICGTTVQAFATNACVVTCPLPKICVTKLVACYLGTNAQGAGLCGTFGKSAIGVSGDTQDPAFCYSITVSNCGTVPMTNVTVVDSIYPGVSNLAAAYFTPGFVFPVGGSANFMFKVELAPGPNNTISVVTNVVTATGEFNGIFTNAQDQAVAEVVPASLSCRLQYSVDNGPLTNGMTLPDQNPHSIVWYITVFNTGLANLVNVSVTDESQHLGCVVSVPPFNLDAGANTGPIALCTNAAFVCTNFASLTDTIMVEAHNYTYGSNHVQVCAHDLNGANSSTSTNNENIVVRSECELTLSCSFPNACRVTGGGRQDDPLVYPHDVRYVTHGGQVGAPVGDRICVVLTNFFLGNPCIHGRWTHVRHVQGGLEGNFHARFYDTLDCACLDTNTTPQTITVPGVDGVPAQTYVNLVYGPGTSVGGVCGNRNIGPLPRPAPANKIVFTGVGDWADPNGRRAPRSTLFRVDIEDRGEPGNSHALGANGKTGRVPDRYRIRIWVLSDQELAELNGSGPDKWLLNFRNAISACNGINVQDGASVVNGSLAFGVRAPDIDDGGELERGNHQIHPMIKQCDPFNPNGPPLANP